MNRVSRRAGFRSWYRAVNRKAYRAAARVPLKAVSRRVASDKGQSLVEFALVLPILLLLILGVVDFGRVLSTGYVISHAARDAARYASIGASDSDIGNVITQDAASVSSSITWSVSPDPTRTSGQPVAVTVTAPVQIFDPILAAFLGQSHQVTSTVTMRVE